MLVLFCAYQMARCLSVSGTGVRLRTPVRNIRLSGFFSSAAGRSASRIIRSNAAAAEGTKIDWDTLGFGLEHAAPDFYIFAHRKSICCRFISAYVFACACQTMYVATWTEAQGWQGTLKPYGPLDMLPSAQVLNYGQSIFEGMKARRSDTGSIAIFRPDKNAERFQDGAARLCMPQVPTDFFIDAIKSTVEANKEYVGQPIACLPSVPPGDKGSLYIRPLLMGTGPILGLGPAPTYTFCIFAAAVGAYFKGGQLTPIDLLVETHFHRAAPGGMGGTKAAGNYSPVCDVQSIIDLCNLTNVLPLH
eukprot:scaffold306687_cov49-Prasinocladus_malaysianus.AAC.1